MSTSGTALDLMHHYVVGKLDSTGFCARYLPLWRELRDSGQMAREPAHVQRGLGVVFTAIDSYDTESTDGPDNKQREAILFAEVRAVLSVLSS